MAAIDGAEGNHRPLPQGQLCLMTYHARWVGSALMPGQLKILLVERECSQEAKTSAT